MFLAAVIIAVTLVYVITYLTHRKIMKESRQMSRENYSLQRRLTVMFIAQVISSAFEYFNYNSKTGLPMIMMHIPFTSLFIGVLIVFSLNDTDPLYRAVFDHQNLGFPIIGTIIVFYPLFNTIATIIIIKPYRQAIFQLFVSCFISVKRVQSSPN